MVTWAAWEVVWLLSIDTSSITKESTLKSPILTSTQLVLLCFISFDYFSNNLISFNFLKQNQTCKFNRESVGATIKGFATIEQGNEQKLMEAVATVGPVAAAMDISHFSFDRYGGGNAIYWVHEFRLLCDPWNLHPHALRIIGSYVWFMSFGSFRITIGRDLRGARMRSYNARPCRFNRWIWKWKRKGFLDR